MKRWTIPLACLIVGAAAGNFVVAPILHGQNAISTPLPSETSSYRDVVKKVMPAVVSVKSKVKPKVQAERRNPRMSEDQIPEELRKQIPEDMRKFFDEFGRGAQDMYEIPVSGFGSGFIVDPKGVVLTNFHVVDGAEQVEVELMDGRKFLSKSIAGDRKTDLAIVRFESTGTLPHLELGNSDAMEIGDRVLAIGAPFGLTGTVTQGIVSAKGRNRLGVNEYEDFIQTDAAINRGNSGGPLISLDGKVIGINTAIKSENGGSQGVGLAIASNLAKSIVKDLQTDGVVHRGYIGVEMRDLTPEVAEKLELKDTTGVIVGRVVPDSPAEKAGLKPLDVVTKLSGKPIKDGVQLRQAVVGLPLSKAVELTVIRDGKTMTVPVTIEEQPDKLGAATRTPRMRSSREQSERPTVMGTLGVAVKDLSADAAERLGYEDGASGALIVRVTPNSPAADAGLRPNMLVTSVDKEPTRSLAEFTQRINEADLKHGVLLQVHSADGNTTYVVVKVE